MSWKKTGQRIRALRKERCLTQETLAEMIGIDCKYLSNIERGKNVCGTRTFLRLANALEASMDYLLADNLAYNRLEKKGEAYEQLLQEIARMDGAEQRHLLKYIRFTRLE